MLEDPFFQLFLFKNSGVLFFLSVSRRYYNLAGGGRCVDRYISGSKSFSAVSRHISKGGRKAVSGILFKRLHPIYVCLFVRFPF